MSDVAIVETRAIEEITEQKIIDYLDSMGKTSNLLENEKKMFINVAREFHLNPFKREIHISAYGQGDNRKCSIITGYEVYIKRAERTGKLDGWKVTTEGEGNNLKAVVEIYRKDMKYPFVHEVYYNECCQYTRDGAPNAIWKKQPKFMTKKVAIGQAFRLCFPDELGGMPYEESEMPQEERNVTENGENLANENKIAPKGENLANEASDPKIVPKPETPRDIVGKIGEVLKKLNPDSLPCFTEKELDMERAIKDGALKKPREEVLPALNSQLDRLTKELAKREADYKPIPFENTGTPTMYSEKEADADYKDDYPLEKTA